MTAYCPECLVVEVSPNAREGRCAWCRPVRRHSQPRRHSQLYDAEALQQRYGTPHHERKEHLT